jgi:integrase
MNNSTRRRKPSNYQSAKPYPDFPLTAHPSGRWCKKILGKLLYFGPLVDWQAALDLWLKQKDELLAGRVPREVTPVGLTLRHLSNAYLKHKKSQVDSGELSPRTLADCYRICAELIDHFGLDRLVDDLRQEDFATYRIVLAKRMGPVALGNTIQRTQSVLKYAYDAGLVDNRPRCGPGFLRPSKKTIRIERAKKPLKLYDAAELRKLIDVAGIPMRTMILLAANAGLGNSDLAHLPIIAINLQTGWVNYPRPKTGIPRRFSLWPETLAAVHKTLAKRPKPTQEADAGLLFLTHRGGRWCKAIFDKKPDLLAEENDLRLKLRQNNDNEVTKEFNKLFKAAGIERNGRSFYCIRHCFETVGGDSRDQVAVDHIMGHADPSMGAVYREKISDERLKGVTDHVRAWLLAKPARRQTTQRRP